MKKRFCSLILCAILVCLSLITVCGCASSKKAGIYVEVREGFMFDEINGGHEAETIFVSFVDPSYRPKNGVLVIPDYDEEGNAVEGISVGAIHDLPYVTEIVIGDQIETVEYAGIYNMPNLKKVTIGKRLVNLHDRVFMNCPQLETVEISPENRRFTSQKCAIYTNNGKYLHLAWGNLEEIPEGVQVIHSGAFMCNSFIRTLTLPETVTKIGSNAFSECVNLEMLVLPDGINEIERYAFYGCPKLRLLIGDQTDVSAFSDDWNRVAEGQVVPVYRREA